MCSEIGAIWLKMTLWECMQGNTYVNVDTKIRRGVTDC